MKKGVKGFVCGVVSTVIIASGLAFAAGNWKTIDVLENDINVLVDGKYISESNFVYNDKTFLPLRSVAEAVGKPIDYDESSNTVYIGTREVVKTFKKIGSYSDRANLSIYEDENGVQYVDFDEINSVTARTGIYTIIWAYFDGSWKFEEWDKNLSKFVERSEGTCVVYESENDIKFYIPKLEYDSKIKPILDIYVNRLYN